MKRILVAYDGSTHSERALKQAARLADALGSRLTLAYVIPPLPAPPDVYGLTLAQIEQDNRAYAEKLLGGAASGVKLPADRIDTLILHGSPATALNEAAQAEDVEMVVVGSHGRGAVSRAVLGSVSSRLAHLCTRPVLIVR